MTPSSKVVGDLALYLVLKGLTTKDLIDPVTNTAVPGATLLDFPESVVGLMKGELGRSPHTVYLRVTLSHMQRFLPCRLKILFVAGFPHRGFPAALTALVLKGNSSGEYATTRAGLALPPVDFEKNIATLSAKHGVVRSAVPLVTVPSH